MALSVVGIDIGDDVVRAVEVSEPSKAKPTILRHHEVRLPPDAVSRGEVLEPNTVSTALRRLWSEAKFGTKDVVLGMGNHRVLARDLTVTKMSIKRIRESLPFHVQEMLPVPVADALLDFYPISESVGENGPQVHGLLIAAVKDAVANNVKAVQLAGLNPVEVDLIPFALSRVLSRGHESDGAIAQIDVGASTTSVLISLAGVPQFIRIIPAGGAELSKVLSHRLEIEVDEAEIMKRRIGLMPVAAESDNPTAVATIREVTGELLNSVRNTVNYFITTRQNEPVRQIVLAGGGTQLPGFREALAEMTKIPVVVAEPFSGLRFGRGVDPGQLQQTQGAYTVALGLALGSTS